MQPFDTRTHPGIRHARLTAFKDEHALSILHRPDGPDGVVREQAEHALTSIEVQGHGACGRLGQREGRMKRMPRDLPGRVQCLYQLVAHGRFAARTSGSRCTGATAQRCRVMGCWLGRVATERTVVIALWERAPQQVHRSPHMRVLHARKTPHTTTVAMHKKRTNTPSDMPRIPLSSASLDAAWACAVCKHSAQAIIVAAQRFAAGSGVIVPARCLKLL